MFNTYDKNFKYVLRGLRNKYGLELEAINNFGSSSLDNTEFVNAFVDEPGIATSDPNANVREKDIVTLQSEMKKADLKLLGFNKLFYELKKKYGLDFAAQWLEDEYKGIYFMHNSSQITFKAYCYSYPLDLIMERGLFFVDRGKSSKPEHYDTFTNQVIEFIAYASNRTTGAVGVPTLLVDMFYYWNKDVSEGHYTKDPDYYRDQQFQNFIYRINQAYIRVDQSPFTNVTIMDKYYIAEMFGDKIYPDGTPAVDYIDEIIEFQKDFMRVVAEIRKNQMMTFPVLSYALLWDDERQEFADIEFARWCSDHNMLWLDSNFFVSKDITTLSSCCLTEDEDVFICNNDNISTVKMKDIEKHTVVELIGNGKTVKGRKVELPNTKMYKIKTHNGKELISTWNHINLIKRDGRAMEVQSKEIMVGDQIAHNESGFDGRCKYSSTKYDTYEFGRLLGVLIGDGSISLHDDGRISSIKICLNYTTKVHTREFLEEELSKFNLKMSEIENAYGIGSPTPVFTITMGDNMSLSEYKNFKGVMSDFIQGDSAHKKYLTDMCLNMSKDFRNGILDGYEETDGGNSNRIYSANKRLITSFGRVLTSLGLSYDIDEDKRTKKDGKLSDNIIYCIRYYSKIKNNFKDYYSRDKKNNLAFFKVVSIEEYDEYEKDVHCFEILGDDEKYFTLANGIYTHNCRVTLNINDIQEKNKTLGFMNSIGGSSLSVGSVVVNTTSMFNLALESKDFSHFKRLLRQKTVNSLKVMDTVRGIIRRNVEKGIGKIYQSGLINMNNQYNTLGIASLYEAIEYFGGISIDEFGNHFYNSLGIKMANDIFDILNEEKDSFTANRDYLCNVEQTPIESAAVKLAKKAKLINKTKDVPYMYGNQWIPLTVKTTIAERTKMASILDVKCGGGSITHLNIDGGFNNSDEAWEMLNRQARDGVIYFAYNRIISTCEDGHSFYGDTCWCGKPATEKYTRVVGFITPVSSWQSERQEEFEERQFYTTAKKD